MEKLFLEARYKGKIVLNDSVIDKLPAKISLATTVQFIDSIEDIKKQLEAKGKTVDFIKGHHSRHNSQILGCDVLNYDISINSECILFIGTGQFHPLALAFRYKTTTYVYNPLSSELNKVSEEQIMNFERKKISATTKFLASQAIGIIKSQKPGQSINQKHVPDLESKYPDKSYYEFISDDIDYIQLNNFNFIECWVNTSCPRIAYDDHEKLDKPIVNILDLVKEDKK